MTPHSKAAEPEFRLTTALVKLRQQERYAERERIARDIHDTLLPGIQALLLRLQIWETHPCLPESFRRQITEEIARVNARIVEGRERILKLRRTQTPPDELRRALMAAASEEFCGQSPAVDFQVRGIAIALTIDAFEHLLEMGREAIRNARTHAQATHIAVELDYRKKSFSMTVTDDGKGLDTSRRRAPGAATHFGLVGMLERARLMSGRLTLSRNLPSGTRVTVIVPASCAYRRRSRAHTSAGYCQSPELTVGRLATNPSLPRSWVTSVTEMAEA